MKLLLLVQNDHDVAHLDAAARAIINSAITGVWVVFSPAITVNTSEAAAKLDAEIAQLRSAESAAAGREDYEAAKSYKVNREGKQLDRAKALRDAWKLAPEEERKKRTQQIFKGFSDTIQSVGGFSLRITGHSDHYEREQWVQMLNSLSGVWFKPFTPGSFVIAWPESVETSIKNAPAQSIPQTPSPISPEDRKKYEEQAKAAARPPAEPPTRREELEALHPMKLGPLMRSMGLEHEGMSRTAKIDAILAAEQKPATAPASVEAY